MSNKPARGPPPGLGANNKANIVAGNVIAPTSTGGNSTNGWIGGGLSGRVGGSNWASSNNGSWPSTWLLLKNLTTQVSQSSNLFIGHIFSVSLMKRPNKSANFRFTIIPIHFVPLKSFISD